MPSKVRRRKREGRRILLGRGLLGSPGRSRLLSLLVSYLIFLKFELVRGGRFALLTPVASRARPVPGSQRFITFTKGMPSPLAYICGLVCVSYYSDTEVGKLALTRVCFSLT